MNDTMMDVLLKNLSREQIQSLLRDSGEHLTAVVLDAEYKTRVTGSNGTTYVYVCRFDDFAPRCSIYVRHNAGDLSIGF